MYEHYLEATPTGVTDLAVTVDEQSTQADADDDSLYTSPPTVTLTLTVAVTTDQRGTVTVSSDGTLTCSMGGLGITDDELKSYFRPAIRLLEALVVDTPYYYSTSQAFLTTDDPADLSDDHILILADAVDPDPHSNSGT
jgi:hypothetical protein